MLQPVLVRAGGDGFELIAGERRWRAARRIGLQTIPAIVRTADDASMLQQAIVENVQREELNPLEEAAAYQQLIEDFSLTHDDVAARGRQEPGHDHEHVATAPAPAVDPAPPEGRTLRMGHARALLGTPDRAFQEQLAKRAVAEDLSVREVEEAIRRREDAEPATAARRRASTKLRPPGSARARGAPRRLPRDARAITMSPRRGRVEIDFATLEDLERIYRVMTEGRAPDAALSPAPSDRRRSDGRARRRSAASMPRRMPTASARASSGPRDVSVGGAGRLVAREQLAHDRGHARLAEQAVGPARGLVDRGQDRAERAR